MKHIYLKTTMVLLLITAALMTIGLRPVQRKSPPCGNTLVAQAGKLNAGT